MTMEIAELKKSEILADLILSLPQLCMHHVRGESVHNMLQKVARKEVESLLLIEETEAVDFSPFGEMKFPYLKMGTVDSLNLFDLDELILFSFYWANKNRYKRVLDIGANIGLHSIVLSRCGFSVKAYEPDPHHFGHLKKNIELNHCREATPKNAAVSSCKGTMEFVRVLGNTTSSHLAGSKKNPYGDLDRFPVPVEDIRNIMKWADLIKMDAEGHEKEILLATERDMWVSTDALVEVENQDNATNIYRHFMGAGVNLFAQKLGWQRVTSELGMPASYREGSLFVTCKERMPWG